MEHTITTEQIKALANLAYFNDFKNKLVEMFPAAFSTIMDRVKTVKDAGGINFTTPMDESWAIHKRRSAAFEEASLVHTALCEGWVPDWGDDQVGFQSCVVVENEAYVLPFWFETEAKRDYFQTQFASLLRTIITGKPI